MRLGSSGSVSRTKPITSSSKFTRTVKEETCNLDDVFMALFQKTPILKYVSRCVAVFKSRNRTAKTSTLYVTEVLDEKAYPIVGHTGCRGSLP